MIRVAKVYQGKCQICQLPVLAGQAYVLTSRSITKNQSLVHYNCYKPTNAPTWEERQARMISRNKQD